MEHAPPQSVLLTRLALFGLLLRDSKQTALPTRRTLTHRADVEQTALLRVQRDGVRTTLRHEGHYEITIFGDLVVNQRTAVVIRKARVRSGLFALILIDDELGLEK